MPSSRVSPIVTQRDLDQVCSDFGFEATIQDDGIQMPFARAYGVRVYLKDKYNILERRKTSDALSGVEKQWFEHDVNVIKHRVALLREYIKKNKVLGINIYVVMSDWGDDGPYR